MLVTPFSTPLHESLASHVFGRFMSPRAQPGVVDRVTAPVLTTTAPDDDAIPDLAQRVREVGEW
jgi:hypothetical protein